MWFLDSLPHQIVSNLRAATSLSCSHVCPCPLYRAAHRAFVQMFAETSEWRVHLVPRSLEHLPHPPAPQDGSGRSSCLGTTHPGAPCRQRWCVGARLGTLTGGTSAAHHRDSPSPRHFQSENPPGKPESRITAPGPASPQHPREGETTAGDLLSISSGLGL